MKKLSLLETLPSEYRGLGAKILDKAHQAARKYMPVYTDFLDPSQQVIGMQLIGQLFGLDAILIGGYEGAERKRLIIFPDDLEGADVVDCICCLEITGNFRFQKVAHRDYLGAFIGTGIKREKIGDILVTEKGCQVILAAEVKEYLLHNVVKINRVSVVVREINSEQIAIPQNQYREIVTTVSSLRLDAVGGAGYSLSRSKFTGYISAEKVKVNWEIRTNSDQLVKEGDIISVRGLGRLELSKITGTTKKGRIGIVLKRLL